MSRKHTASFILELPLKTDPEMNGRAAIILDAGRNIGDAVLGEGLRPLWSPSVRAACTNGS
jgi:hypothetical protein